MRSRSSRITVRQLALPVPAVGPARRRRALEAVEKAHCIRWMVALGESPGGAGLGGLGLLPRCGLGLGGALAE
jgi:hypothetical protein